MLEPIDTRIAFSCGVPMACKTCDGRPVPLAHAELLTLVEEVRTSLLHEAMREPALFSPLFQQRMCQFSLTWNYVNFR